MKKWAQKQIVDEIKERVKEKERKSYEYFFSWKTKQKTTPDRLTKKEKQGLSRWERKKRERKRRKGEGIWAGEKGERETEAMIYWACFKQQRQPSKVFGCALKILKKREREGEREKLIEVASTSVGCDKTVVHQKADATFF